MLKQAQSVSLAFQEFDTTNNVLHYGQKPLVSTSVERVYDHGIGLTGRTPSWRSCRSVQPGGLDHHEQGELERGFGRCTRLKTIKDTLCPDETYEQFPSENTLVKKGDTILLKKKTGYRRGEEARAPR